ncbi:hypothetical protein ZOSMA_92G00730 [Zostera marina]|uniref:Uncharacterized protein n=1 Tax=Zostera marina TaxID=29655 RepID=A0A0K9NJB9_ZOSMR|nr:hypothetical protein ZOSMA_92G00730 [Zostera marina]
MERQFSSFCKSLGSFLSHVESTTTSLTQSIQSPPIPIDSVTSSFLRTINSRASTVGESFERLESLTIGTVSSEELLGHCNEVYKMHEMHIRNLEEFLSGYGYVPPPSPPPAKSFLYEENDEFQSELEDERTVAPVITGKNDSGEDNDQLFADNMTKFNSDGMHNNDIFNNSTNTLDTSVTVEDVSVSHGSSTNYGIKISKGSYDGLASFMKTLASWEDLVEAVAKINSQLSKHIGQNGTISFTENDIEPLGYGSKGRTYILLLYKMKSLAMESVVGSTSSTVYHVI